jgi:hypothetical protein
VIGEAAGDLLELLMQRLELEAPAAAPAS